MPARPRKSAAKKTTARRRQPAPSWHNVISSRVHRAQYNPKTQVANVIFADGTDWHYNGVSRAQFNRLLNHEHPGSYINTLTAHARSHGPGHRR